MFDQREELHDGESAISQGRAGRNTFYYVLVILKNIMANSGSSQPFYILGSLFRPYVRYGQPSCMCHPYGI